MIYNGRDINSSQVLQRDSSTNAATIVIDNVPTKFKTGGPYTICNAINVYVGDIWVMAGQSNMRGHGFLKNPFTQKSYTLSCEPGIHLYDSSETWRVASDPTHNLKQSNRKVHSTLPDPTVRHPEICQYRGASLGLAFAKEYQKLSQGIPIGLIASAHGGVSLYDWRRPDVIDDDTVDTTLYGAMIDRIRRIGGDIAGVLWYQGESDTLDPSNSNTYGERFKDWISGLRKDTRSDLPIAFVQLGPHRIDVPETVAGWMRVQDQQGRLFGLNDYTAGVSSIDCGLDDRLHLSADGLHKVGRRLASAAILAKTGQANKASPRVKCAIYEEVESLPQLVTMYSIKIEFDNMEGLEWNCSDSEVFGFELEGADSIRGVAILSARVEDWKYVRIYLSASPSLPLYINYGMNQHTSNLVASNGMAQPAFKNETVFRKGAII